MADKLYAYHWSKHIFPDYQDGDLIIIASSEEKAREVAVDALRHRMVKDYYTEPIEDDYPDEYAKYVTKPLLEKPEVKEVTDGMLVHLAKGCG